MGIRQGQVLPFSFYLVRFRGRVERNTEKFVLNNKKCNIKKKYGNSMSFLYSDEHIERKMLELKENDFSKKILIPLFKSIHNGKVEFVGGGPEKGRDILFTVENAYGEVEITAVQVKKVKPNANAATTQSMQNVITQLNQCKSESVVLANGSTRRVDHLIFVTPYIINQTVLDVHRGALEDSIQKNVRIMGGDQIIDLVNKKCPNLFDCLFEHTPAVAKNLEPLLSNDEVYRALNLSSNKRLCDIYCSVDTVIGNASKSSMLNMIVTNVKKQVTKKVSLATYNVFFKERVEKYTNSFGSSFLINQNVVQEKETIKKAFQHEINIANSRAAEAKERVITLVAESAFKNKLNNINHPVTFIKISDDETKRIKSLEVEGKLLLPETKFKVFLDSIKDEITKWNINLLTLEKDRRKDRHKFFSDKNMCLSFFINLDIIRTKS